MRASATDLSDHNGTVPPWEAVFNQRDALDWIEEAVFEFSQLAFNATHEDTATVLEELAKQAKERADLIRTIPETGMAFGDWAMHERDRLRDRRKEKQIRASVRSRL